MSNIFIMEIIFKLVCLKKYNYYYLYISISNELLNINKFDLYMY